MLAQRSWSGTRDAGQAFKFAFRGNFLQNEFVQVMQSPSVHHYNVRTLLYFVRGDDNVGVGTRHDVDWYFERARTTWGPKMRILSRVISCSPRRDGKQNITYNPLAGPMLAESRMQPFLSLCMRCSFLAFDRPDSQFVAKEVIRAMSAPGTWLDTHA